MEDKMKIALGSLDGIASNPLIMGVLTSLKDSLIGTGCKVDIIGTRQKDPRILCITDPEKLNDYEAVILFSQPFVFFGGSVDKSAVDMFKLLHKFKGKIFYWYEDARWGIETLSEKLEGRTFWLNNPLCDIEELTIDSPIHVLSQFYSEETVRGRSKVKLGEYFYVPTFLCHLNRQCVKPLFGKTVDLIYGGVNRHSKRNQFFKDYYVDLSDEFVVEFYGGMKDLKDVELKNCIKSSKVPYTEVLTKNSTAYATLILPEKYYSNNTITARIMEALSSDVICFIHNDFDEEHKILQDDYFYIHSPKELREKLTEIKTNSDIYKRLLSIQSATLEKYKNIDIGGIVLKIIRSVV